MRAVGRARAAGTVMVAAALVLAGFAGSAAAAKIPKPKASPLVAEPRPLPFTGGSVQVTSTVDRATSCVLSSSTEVAGLPVSFPCSSGEVSETVVLPQNESSKPVPHKLTLTVTGPGGTIVKNRVVRVARPPKPTAVPFFAAPSHLSSAGGSVLLSTMVDLFTSVPGAGACTFSSGRAVDGLPVTLPCSTGTVSHTVVLPPNAGRKPLPYKLKVKIAGPGGAIVLSTVATVTTDPAPLTAPGPVENVAGVAGDGEVTLSWSAPDDTGGSTVTGYQYEYSSDGGFTWSATSSVGPVTSTVVSGLTNGTAYRFRVAAVNMVGAGEWSAPSAPVTPQGAKPVLVQVAAGSNHTCGLTDKGAVLCWGSNDSGQLGDGTTTNRSVPVSVQGLTSGVTSIAAGSYFTCAVTSAGAAKCWGDNSYGELGDGTLFDSAVPVQVSGLTSGVSAVSGGNVHACALVSGAAKCWGSNEVSQLGDGGAVNSLVPVQVSGLTSGVTQVSAGYNHTCAVVGGAARCWGDNARSQLGDGTTTLRTVPTQVSGLTTGVTQVSTAFAHTCAVVSGAARCWGLGANGRLGDGTVANRVVPTQVSGLTTGVTQISAGHDHTCAVVSGAARCWGLNTHGQLGDGTSTTRLVPTQVSGLTSGVTQIAAGDYHTAAITTGGPRCWGFNVYGQVGDGTNIKRTVPTPVSGT